MSTPRKGTYLTRERIRAWCEAHRRRTGRFPASASGPVVDHVQITWNTVNKTLRRGNRSLPGGDSLARFLVREFDVVDRRPIQRLTPQLILKWVEAYRARNGRWPAVHPNSRVQEPIPESPGDNWRIIDAAMRRGGRGYKGPHSLSSLLGNHYGEKYRHWLAPLSVKLIIEWAEKHKARTGKWPRVNSGPIPEAPPNTWCGINDALLHRRRGLLGGITLAQLLDRHLHTSVKVRNRRYRADPPQLTIEFILGWADQHRERTGQWPKCTSGAVVDAPEENWGAIHSALGYGCRGLPGGTTLAKFLAEHRGAPIKPSGPLTIEQILAWADAFHERTGEWPTRKSGPIGPGINGYWGGVQNSLQKGLRGLPFGSSLARILRDHRDVGRGNGQAAGRSRRSGKSAKRRPVRRSAGVLTRGRPATRS